MSYTTFDIETTTKFLFGRKASPFHKENWVVTHAFKNKDGAVTEHRFGKQRPGPGWLRPVLASTRLLVGFNIKFDVLHALQDSDNLEAWMDYVVGGGRIWDCQLAEYLLCGMDQPNQMLSLDEVAPRYGGNVKVDEVKALWNAGVQTEDIDPELLSRYLCGGKDETGTYQLGDIENTEKIALGQIQRARECGQLNSILLNMGALMASIEMERNGLYADKALGIVLAGELETLITELRAGLNAYLPHDLPFDFNWGSRIHKSALIFGGTVYYEGMEYVHADGTGTECGEWDALCGFGTPSEYKPLTYPQKDAVCVQPNTEVLTDPQKETCKRLEVIPGYITQEDAKAAGIPVLRFSSGKREGEAKTKAVKVPDTTRPKKRKCSIAYTFPRMTEPKKAWESAEKGVYSVAEEVIEELKLRGIPFVKALATLQKAVKDLGTYFIVTDANGKQKGMLTLVGEDGIIHHSINHTSTITGRLSASNPNSQNFPKGNHSKLKLVFCSRFGADGKIIQSDFSALEIYIQAILTQCKQLIDDLKAGLDMHCLRLANKEGMPYDEVYALCKGDKYSEEWDYKRTGAKMYSFAAAYGAGDAKIAADNDMSVDEVAAFRAADDSRYPEIPAYYEDLTERIKANRKPTGTAIPHPDCPGVMCNLGRSTYRTPDGKLYSYSEHPAPEYLVRRRTYQSFSPTEIKNYVSQGEGGEWMKAAMYMAVRMFYKYRNFGGMALLVNTVHDAQYVDAHNSVAFDAACVLHACMEAANDYMEYIFDWKIPVPVPSDTSWGLTMKDEEKIPSLKEEANKYRTIIRDEFLGGYIPSFAQ
jgi:hypothetical protein